MGFIFLFFFMEETNYNREPVVEQKAFSDSAENQHTSSEKGVINAELEAPTVNGTHFSDRSQRSYIQKLSLFRRDQLRQPNRLLGMVLRPLQFLTFPVIVYAGFTYGANLVWFNVLNGMLVSTVVAQVPRLSCPQELLL